jgi:hypothetical protein
MRYAFVAGLVGASLVAAAPTAVAPAKRAAAGQQDIDTTILNYALTLEHLEAAFYNEHLPSKAAFEKAGYPGYVYYRYREIGGEEKQHVSFLSTALGDMAVKACTYDFGLTGVDSFVATSQLLEGVGISAYLGAAQNITNPAYLTAAGSILTVEARHNAWIQAVPEHSDPFPTPYDTPLDFSQVYSLAAPLIKSCPKSNAALPVTAFPAATISPAPTNLGQTVTVKSSKLQSGDVAGFISGLSQTIVPIKNGKVTLPKTVTYGRSYLVILKSGSTAITDDNTVAGPVVIDILKGAIAASEYQQSQA